jgi:hypothetical protein
MVCVQVAVQTHELGNGGGGLRTAVDWRWLRRAV